MDINFQFKMLLLGDPAVGKTSLMLRYIDNKFSKDYISTIGVDFMTKDVTNPGGDVRLIIWDVAGQSKYASFRKLYFDGTNYVIFVFDITDRMSFTNIDKWINGTLPLLKGDIKFAILGNKADLESSRKVSQLEYFYYSNRYPNLDFFMETSAKTGGNVDIVFQRICEGLLKQTSS